VGVGWLEEEFDALGVPFRRRGARADEYIEVMRQLWEADHAAHDGEFVSFDDVSSNPKPARGRVPIVVGGHSEAAARRAGRIGDGFFPGTGDLPVLFDIVRQTAADAGRDPSAVELTAGHPGIRDDPAAAVEELASLGVSRVVVPAFFFSRGDLASNLAEFGERVIQPSA
jgi:alkanesulfonate monooxygenase SsuD/methylene tetrahydromethanopterin reductase-like flavin-dependent oxidoreductase (luciferase family)